MKKLLFIFTLLPFICFSQNSEQGKKSNISLGLSFAPEADYRFIQENNFNRGFFDDEIFQFGFSTGLNLNWRINQLISFETGVLFSKKGYGHKTWLIQDRNDFERIRAHATYNYYFLDIPLKAKFYPFNSVNGLFISIGVVPNIFLSSDLTFKAGDDKFSWEDEGKVPSLNLSVLGGIGYEYMINSNLFLKVEGNFKSFVTPLHKNSVNKRYLYSIGLDFCLYYRL